MFEIEKETLEKRLIEEKYLFYLDDSKGYMNLYKIPTKNLFGN